MNAPAGEGGRGSKQKIETRSRACSLLPASAQDVAAAESSLFGDLPHDRPATRPPHVTHNSGEVDWHTPAYVLDAARDVLGGIDLDPASSAIANQRVQATRYFTPPVDGAREQWRGRVWLNPPYQNKSASRFVAKLIQEHEQGRVLAAIALLNNASDTGWWQGAAARADAICQIRGRIRFLTPKGNSGSPLQGSTLFYFGPHLDTFAARFGDLGVVLRVGR